MDTAANPPVRIEYEWLVTRDMFLKMKRTVDPQTKAVTPFAWESWDGEHAYQLIYWQSDPGRVMTIQQSQTVPNSTWGSSVLLACLGFRYPALAQDLTQLLSQTDISVESLPDATGYRLRFGPSELWVPGCRPHRLTLWMNSDADRLPVVYLVEPAWVTDELRQQGPVKLNDGETVSANFVIEFQEVVDPETKLSYRFPRVCGPKESPIEIEVLAINPPLLKSRFRPEFTSGVELITNAGAAAQKKTVIGGADQQQEHHARSFAEQAAFQGAQAVRANQEREAAAPWSSHSWLFWLGSACFAGLVVGAIARFRQLRN